MDTLDAKSVTPTSTTKRLRGEVLPVSPTQNSSQELSCDPGEEAGNSKRFTQCSKDSEK